jgi:F0F1-type ATP synthase membrane subunit b/b'
MYSAYSQATSPQNNAVSSLESNSIIQWIITSSANGYSTVAQYLANFLSIRGVPTYVWTIITFLMATLFFIAIYTYLFEIFIQRTGISESETMRKAKILLIFTLSLFSAIAIGFAIPFLFNLYGFILLIFLLIALFFFGRATVSYGKSFHHAAKSFATNVERDLVNAKKELKEAKRYLSKEEANQITEGIDKIFSIYNEARNALSDADMKFQKALSTYKSFINDLIRYLKNLKKFKKLKGKKQLQQKINNFIKKLRNIRDNLDPRNTQTIPSISKFYNIILSEVNNLGLNQQDKKNLIRILNNKYNTFRQKIISEIQEAIKAYNEAEVKLKELYSFENALKNDINLRFRSFFHVPGSRKVEAVMLLTLNNLKNDITNAERLINSSIQSLHNLLN